MRIRRGRSWDKTPYFPETRSRRDARSDTNTRPPSGTINSCESAGRLQTFWIIWKSDSTTLSREKSSSDTRRSENVSIGRPSTGCLVKGDRADRADLRQISTYIMLVDALV